MVHRRADGRSCFHGLSLDASNQERRSASDRLWRHPDVVEVLLNSPLYSSNVKEIGVCSPDTRPDVWFKERVPIVAQAINRKMAR